jgi:phage tail-like protein
MSVTTGQLIVRLAGNVVQVMPLNVPIITVGRAPDNTLALSDPLISRRHAEIRVQDGVPVLVDVGSSNGTRVDGNRILPNQPYPITTGTVVQVGSYTITYQPEGAAQQADGADGEQPAVEQTAPLAIVEAAPPPPNGHAPLLAALPMRRVAFPMERAEGPASSYLRFLPVIYQDNDFMGRFLLIFESIWEPLERRQDQIAMYFDPHTCPPGFLSWIGGWLDLSINTDWPERRIRRFIAEAMDLYRWRGTRYGLERMIEVCTGVAPQVTEPPGQPFVFQVTMHLPQDTDVDRALVEQLIVAHKPAHTGYVLEIAE